MRIQNGATVEVNDQQVGDIIAYLVSVFGLERWDIRWKVVKAVTLDGAKGDCEFDSQARAALVRIRENQESLEDCVDTIVHELVHIVLWWADFDESNGYDNWLKSTVLEQSMRDLTKPIARLVIEHLDEIVK